MSEQAKKYMRFNKEDSLKKRYLFKLGTNLVGMVIGIITQAIIPRGLGPKAYGDFNYISNFFTQIVGFLDMGTSVGFYTKLSKRPKESSLVSFYLYFSVIVSFVIVVFVMIAAMTSVHSILWPAQELIYIYLGVAWGILYWIVLVLSKMADAYGITVSTEIVQIFQKFFGLALIVLLYASHLLSLTNFFYYQFILFLVLCVAFIWVMERSGFSFYNGWRLSREQIKVYAKEFYDYSHPLFSYAVVGLIVGILDRWLLQTYAGSVQQGFYSLSYQIGALCFLFTGAMTPLLTREFSIAFGSNDLSKMAVLFRRYIPLLYATAAYFSCFIALQADKVIYILGGSNYSGALLPVMIMAFYPIHQTYGQLSGAIFYATGQTALYRNIGILFMVAGLPITYVLIAPTQNMGLNAGAAGLALKMVVIQFVGVNVQLYFNARFLKLPFYRYLGHQVISVGSLLLVAAFASTIVSILPFFYGSMIMSFIAAGILYTLLVIGLVYCLPMLFGLRRNDIQSAMEYIQNKLTPSV